MVSSIAAGQRFVNAQVIIRHLLGGVVGVGVFLIGIPAGLCLVADALERHWTAGLMASDAIRTGLAIGVGAIGLAFAFWSNLELMVVGKGGPCDGFGLAISPRTQSLVTSGPYRYSRNPMAFGALLFNTGVALWLNSPFCLALMAAITVLAVVYLKLVEERRLLRDFDGAYEQYRRAVSMLVPWPPRKPA